MKMNVRPVKIENEIPLQIKSPCLSYQLLSGIKQNPNKLTVNNTHVKA